jgi:hypothetical protein
VKDIMKSYTERKHPEDGDALPGDDDSSKTG